MFDLFEYVLGLEIEYSWLTSDCHLGLILRTMTGSFTHVVFFFPIYCEKVLDNYKCFKWKTNTWSCKLLQLGLNVQDYDWTFDSGNLFLSIYCKKETHLYIWKKTNYLWLIRDYQFGLILIVMTWPFTLVAFFSHYYLKWSRHELVILNLIMKRVWCWVKCLFSLRYELSYENGLRNDLKSLMEMVWFGKLFDVVSSLFFFFFKVVDFT